MRLRLIVIVIVIALLAFSVLMLLLQKAEEYGFIRGVQTMTHLTHYNLKGDRR